MMKTSLIPIILISNIYAFSLPTTSSSTSSTSIIDTIKDKLKICSILSSNDLKAQQQFASDTTKCFNAYDIPFTSSSGVLTSPISIGTKISSNDFMFKIMKKPYCHITNLTYSLVDNSTHKTIPNTTKTISNPIEANFVKYNIPKSYKNVSVKFTYTQTVGMTNISKTEYSSDNFSIRPKEFDITLLKNPIKTSKNEPFEIKTLDNKGNIVTNYLNSSLNLQTQIIPSTIKASYSYEISNGISKNSSLSFNSTDNNVQLKIIDSHFSDIDADDTAQSCRDITGTSNKIDIIASSKYWAGFGTNEKENTPTNHTIQSDIKQNTKKDLHFNKMGW